jgi:hypothetical protein
MQPVSLRPDTPAGCSVPLPSSSSDSNNSPERDKQLISNKTDQDDREMKVPPHTEVSSVVRPPTFVPEQNNPRWDATLAQGNQRSEERYLQELEQLENQDRELRGAHARELEGAHIKIDELQKQLQAGETKNQADNHKMFHQVEQQRMRDFEEHAKTTCHLEERLREAQDREREILNHLMSSEEKVTDYKGESESLRNTVEE